MRSFSERCVFNGGWIALTFLAGKRAVVEVFLFILRDVSPIKVVISNPRKIMRWAV